MPDLNIEIMWMCASNRYWQTEVQGKTAKYTVTFQERGGWHCTCKGFKYRANCRHINQVRGQKCTWHEQFNSGEVKDEKCPRCGGEAVPVRVAV